jgi:hypothetical protein
MLTNNPVTSLEDRSLDDVGHTLGQGEEILFLMHIIKWVGRGGT